MREIMSGNEATARGAYEGGCVFASAYPGTPSTEILENMPQYKEKVYCEWAPNEKVALEAAIGASVAGVRSFAAMKHVGLNVAADPAFTFAYTGVTGGCVIVSADDPGQHSSQNEQDNRNYAKAARLLMLSPASSQEAKDFMKMAFKLSEQFDTPVLFHTTTRVCHSKGLVELGDREEVPAVPYKKNIKKYVASPANAIVMRGELEKRLVAMEEFANTVSINQPEWHDKKIGIVTSGIAYQYAKEAFGDKASYLKLGMTFPLPTKLIKDFCSQVEKVYVVEEMDPYLEEFLKMNGIECQGKELLPKYGELNTDILRHCLLGEEIETLSSEKSAVVRPPVLCAGCPHRGFFYTLSKKKGIMITGDIGCYTLGSAPPLSALDTTFCMGGSISTGYGAAQAFKKAEMPTKVVAVIGDSTFFHTGIPSLIGASYNGASSTTVILDNRITGMTGHQENPGTGFTLMGDPAIEVDIPALCEAIGIKKENIWIVDPNDLKEVSGVLDEAIAKDEPTVVITRWPCMLKKFSQQDKDEFTTLNTRQCYIDQEACRNCKSCVRTGCPALISTKEKVVIDKNSCTGCTVCKQVCPFNAISEVAR